jgi:signal transduction histidine kinase/ligand-binding sensor domain-containing protein
VDRPRTQRTSSGRAVIALGFLVASWRCAFALDPSLDISQYAHTAWKIREGSFKGTIQAIAQTPDGYLWLGTEFGLLRFDGEKNVPWQPPAGEQLPSSAITGLLAARDGTLWIGTLQGLASWKDGELVLYQELAGQLVLALLEDHEGTVWAGGSAPLLTGGRLCEIHGGAVRCHGEDGSFGRAVESLYEDSRENLWAGAQTGLWRWKPGPPKLYPMPDPTMGVRSLIEGDKGALLISMRGGIRQLLDGKGEMYRLPAARPLLKPGKLLRDRNGGLWIGTHGRGLMHVHQGRLDVFAQTDGLSDDDVLRLFEDREGNIWVTTTDGLDRFREFAVPRFSSKQGLSASSVWSVMSARDGSVWLGNPDGLNRWNNGQITIYHKRRDGPLIRPPEQSRVREQIFSELPEDVESLFQDDHGRIWVFGYRGVAYFDDDRLTPVSSLPGGYARSVVGDKAGNLWISDQDHGLFHLVGGNLVERIPWATLGRTDFAHSLSTDPAQGGVWLGFYQGGLEYFRDGQVRASYKVADGLGKGIVADVQVDKDGALWAATEGGLSRVKNGRVSTLSSKNGLPCDSVHWAREDNDHSFWLYMACGLVRIERTQLDAWVVDPKRSIQATVFDSSDGVKSHSLPSSSFSPQVAKTADGKLWFLPGDGVSTIDPRHLAFNKLPPPVHIEQITADHESYPASPHLRLPPLIRDLAIDYTALSLAIPEKVRFRFKLEGQDRDWREVVNVRRVQYSNLAPGGYRFRVTASNNSGVWNEQGASLDFSIAPAYWQTRWFIALCVAAFMALLWALYQLRLRQLARQFNMTLDARVGERTRIARELHDTLLQSFHGLLLRFQTAYELLPTRPADAKQSLGEAIDRAAQAVTEGRDAVQGLRSSSVETNDLAVAIKTIGEELAANEGGHDAVDLHVQVEGSPRPLHPILRDEVYRIAGEALRNAFRHAQATKIEVELRYDERQLRLRIRDDGKGIDPTFLSEGGRAGHYGLHGMRERARLMGGKLTVWSALDSGTELELSIPASLAYAATASPPRSWF